MQWLKLTLSQYHLVPILFEQTFIAMLIMCAVMLSVKVSVLKARITDEIGIPASKQKLQIGVSLTCIFRDSL